MLRLNLSSLRITRPSDLLLLLPPPPSFRQFFSGSYSTRNPSRNNAERDFSSIDTVNDLAMGRKAQKEEKRKRLGGGNIREVQSQPREKRQLSRLTGYESNVVESLERPRFFQSSWTGASDDIATLHCTCIVHVRALQGNRRKRRRYNRAAFSAIKCSLGGAGSVFNPNSMITAHRIVVRSSRSIRG